MPLNEFEIDPSERNLNPDTVPLPNMPVDQYDPNALARITPKADRAAAKLAYKAWKDGGMIGPFDGGAGLTYLDE